MYICDNGHILTYHDGAHAADRYFYLHDRLGSVRQVIDTSGDVKNRYIYQPFGELYPAPDFEETVDNSFKFAGQYFDSEIEEYYMRARQYDPHIYRFTARDPVFGKFKEPLTLHAYLYCLNDPINHVDPSGELLGLPVSQAIGAKMRAMSLAMGKLGMSIAGKVYLKATMAYYALNVFLYDLQVYGKINMPGFRGPEWGKWGPNQSIQGWHFHLPWGPGLGEHHLPQEFGNWWRNLMAVWFGR